MVFGLGSGSTAAFAVEAVAARIATGLRVVVIPSSETAAALARQFGVPLTSFAKHRRIDVTIDGADQLERGTLNGIKGLGGALFVASASDRTIVVIDETKLVDRIGRSTPLPGQDNIFWVASRARPPVDVRLQAAIAHDRRQTFKDGQQQLHHRLHHRRDTGPRCAGGPFFCHRRRWRGGDRELIPRPLMYGLTY
jgi:ribose 5-phosphate isomerase